MDQLRQTRTSFIKIFLRRPSILRSTRVTAWLGLAVSSRTDLPIIRLMHEAKPVQYVEPQDDHVFLASLSQNHLNSELGVFGYIAVI